MRTYLRDDERRNRQREEGEEQEVKTRQEQVCGKTFGKYFTPMVHNFDILHSFQPHTISNRMI